MGAILSASVGMFLVGVIAANATDLQVPAAKAPVLKAPPAPIGYTWSGCHLGIQGGGAWGTSRHTQDDFRDNRFGRPMTDDFNLSGAEIGGTVGCDYQLNYWVIGIENDFSWTNKKGSATALPSFTPEPNTFETNEKWLDTQRARLGFAWDHWFVYGTGGVAFAQAGVHLCSPLAVNCGNASHTVTGWTAGAGVAYAFWSNWSVKLEYLHVDFGTSLFPELVTQQVGGGNGFFIARDVKLTNDIVRAGLDYKIDWPSAVMTRY
jgi:outer membrane immunogenic protein